VLFYARTRARVLWAIYALVAAPTLFVLYDVPGESPEASWTALEHIANHAFKVVPLVWLFVWTALGRARGGTVARATGPAARRLAPEGP